MIFKKDEIEYYSRMYYLAFEVDKTFFYEKESSDIFAYLSEKYWGDSLVYRLTLLAKLFYFDSSTHPSKMKNELIKKSEELKKYLEKICLR